MRKCKREVKNRGSQQFSRDRHMLWTSPKTNSMETIGGEIIFTASNTAVSWIKMFKRNHSHPIPE